ncbi:hypothetical protein H2200_003554 [Cladophialophora chaetospira]|uniref:Uncharacterized protein n=1 Tax=Cladophialophora chaetospira TaxID=386627 RepID=A0AA39CK37_9EURO|nr:hypothetical protein H2200_003554 [Cladophialophora chaetospira]
MDMPPPNRPLVTQAEYIEQCLILCTNNNAWLSQYRQTPPKERPAMLKAITTRIQANANLAATRSHDMLQFAESQEVRAGFWKMMSSRRRKAYLNEVKSVELLRKKVAEVKRIFEGTPYLLTDEESEEWLEFCNVKATYKESLDRKLEAAEETLEELRSLCEKRGTSTANFHELVRLHKQQGGAKMRAGKGDLQRKNRGLVRSAVKKRKRTLRQAFISGAVFASGLVCGVLGVAWKYLESL